MNNYKNVVSFLSRVSVMGLVVGFVYIIILALAESSNNRIAYTFCIILSITFLNLGFSALLMRQIVKKAFQPNTSVLSKDE